MSDTSLEDIVSLCKRRGFIFQGSDVYGGLSGTWDYGPLGVALKRNIMQLWWKMFVEDRDDMHGVDAAILMNQKVWQASGHVETFVDPLCEDTVNHRRFRTDHILKDNGVNPEGMSLDQMDVAITEKGILSPDGNLLSKSQTFNMMLKTVMGPKYYSVERKESAGMTAEVKFFNKKGEQEHSEKLNDEFNELGGFMFYDTNAVSYLRPETAQGIFTNYKNVVDSIYPDFPFGIAQQGKAFRNEISPRDFIFRDRELEQMEIEYFVHEDDWEEAFEMWRLQMYAWCEAIGLEKSAIHELEVDENDRAHYSKRTIDIEYGFPIGKEELYGLAYRTNFDLTNIQNASGKKMDYRPKDGGKAFVPHVIEPTFGVERTIMAVLTAAYWNDTENDRIVLKLPAHLAPVKVAVSPLLKNKPELVAKAKEVYNMLKKEFGAVMWDDNGNIGKRYRRQDEIGTPYCVVIDFETLEGDADGNIDTVTVRHRDTTEQTRVSLDKLVASFNL